MIEEGPYPAYPLSDRGSQFKCASYRRWCKRRGILPRYGHLGEPSSIPIVERFMRTLKDGCFRRILVPITAEGVRRELRRFATWYNQHRPHTHLDGRTPDDVYFPRRRRRRRLEPRPRYRRGRPRDKPDRFTVVIDHVDGKRHLPIIELKRVA
jgi:transposase InsO family protein